MRTFSLQQLIAVVVSSNTVWSVVLFFLARNVNFLFPIQAKTFDYVYDGEDLLGQAQTGTGKTVGTASYRAVNA